MRVLLLGFIGRLLFRKNIILPKDHQSLGTMINVPDFSIIGETVTNISVTRLH